MANSSSKRLPSRHYKPALLRQMTDDHTHNLDIFDEMFPTDAVTKLKMVSSETDENNGGEFVSVEVLVPEDSIGYIIGTGGQNLRRIAKETGAEVKPPKRGEPPVFEIRSSKNKFARGAWEELEKLAQAWTKLQSKIRRQGTENDLIVEIRLNIPVDAVRYVTGRNGAIIAKIASETNTEIERPNSSRSSSVFKIIGSERDAERARRRMMSLAQSFVLKVSGYGGTQSSLFVADEGDGENDDVRTVKLSVPLLSSQIEAERLLEIEQSTGARIKTSSDSRNNPGRQMMFEISGTRDQVKLVKTEIAAIVSDKRNAEQDSIEIGNKESINASSLGVIAVKNLADKVTKRDLWELFNVRGGIGKITIHKKRTGTNCLKDTRWATVELQTQETARQAASHDGHCLFGQKIRVRPYPDDGRK